MCQKPHPEKNRFDWKIPRSNNSGMPRSNPKVKWENEMGNHKKPEKTGFNWKNRKNGKWEKWESVTKMKKTKTLKEMSIL